MEVTYEEYTALKKKFLDKLDGRWTVETSSMDQYGGWRKEYVEEMTPRSKVCRIWYESMTQSIETVTAETVIHGTRVRIEKNVRFIRTEFWSTVDPKSRYLYEAARG